MAVDLFENLGITAWGALPAPFAARSLSCAPSSWPPWGCGGMPYDCGGIRGKITQADSVDGFSTAAEGYVEAGPGFSLVEVVVEPDPGNFPRNVGYGDFTVDLLDARGNAYPRTHQGWYGTTQQYRLYYRVPDDASGFRFQGVDLGL